MSKEAIDKMMQAANQDAALRQALETAKDLAEVVEIGAENDYQFTKEELQAAVKERGGMLQEDVAAEGELSEEALEAVAGGADWTDNWRIRIPW